MSPLISLDTDESLRWSTGLERISAATPVIAEWGRTGRCGGAGRIAESWQHCVEIWVERGAGCSGLRGPSCRAVSHVACAGRGAVATFGRHLRGCMVPYGRGRAPTQRPGTGNGTEVGRETLHPRLLSVLSGADASVEATRSRMLIPAFSVSARTRPGLSRK